VNSAPVADAALGFLGDVLAVPSWVPGAKVFSVGDVLIAVGAAIVVHVACRRPPWMRPSPRAATSAT
jgi:hypothetical protein